MGSPQEINVGDVVEVVDVGRVYSTYSDWFTQHNIQRGSWREGNELYGHVGGNLKVLAKGRHGYISDILLFIEEVCTGYRALIGVDGVKLVSSGGYPNPPHKHRDLIVAWANGAEIEHLSAFTGKWYGTPCPCWGKGDVYRIKPQPNKEKQEAIKKLDEIQENMRELEAQSRELGELIDKMED